MLVILLGSGGGFYFKSYLLNTAPKSFPQIDGEIQLGSLDGPVDIYRDKMGSGRIAEMLGRGQLDSDVFLRTLGWAHVVVEELKLLPPEDLTIIQAYSDGVNAYLADRKGEALSLEYSILKLLTPGCELEPWIPLHSITWTKAMAWDLGNLNSSVTVHTTGQSGHAYHPHYIDMAELWTGIKYYPM
jgi:acyl-homoserine lactone acylase PvdQ